MQISYSYHYYSSNEFHGEIFLRFVSFVACNNHVQCRTFDYDMRSSICRLFEGSVETGQIVLSGLIVSRAGAVRHSLNLYAAFGRPCVQCAQSRYLICSSNNTCQCPLKTVWNSVKCVNQGYEDATCLSNQWCRIDRGYTCSNLHFCTGTLTSFPKNAFFRSIHSICSPYPNRIQLPQYDHCESGSPWQ